MSRYSRAEVDAYVKIRAQITGARLVTAAFVGAVLLPLKLFGALSWSWWWVTSPFWGGAAYLVAAMVGIAVFGAAHTTSQPKPKPTAPQVDPLRVVRADDA